MAQKVYWIGLEIVAKSLKRYIERNQLGLQANLTPAQFNCVTALLSAVIECLSALPKNTPTG